MGSAGTEWICFAAKSIEEANMAATCEFLYMKKTWINAINVISWIIYDQIRLVCIVLTYHRPLGCSLVKFPSFFWFKVVSSELDPLWLERVWEIGDFGLFERSNRPDVVSACSQEVLLQSYIGSFGWLCKSWPVEAPKVGPPIDENSALQGRQGAVNWHLSYIHGT